MPEDYLYTTMSLEGVEQILYSLECNHGARPEHRGKLTLARRNGEKLFVAVEIVPHLYFCRGSKILFRQPT